MRRIVCLAVLTGFVAACGNGENNREPDAGSDTGGADAGTSVDPAPGVNTPGEHTLPASCSGCPDSNIDTFTIAAGETTSYRFEGIVTGAQGNGVFYIQGPNGGEIEGTIFTDATGNFSFEAPLFCGEQLVKCLWSNDAGQYVVVVNVVTDNCVEPDIRATLTWDDLGADWELHLIKPGGRINDPATDCTWNTCASLDWGVAADASDDPKKDVDNTGHFGPENIYLRSPEAGTYKVMVEHWGAGDPNSDGAVTITVKGKSHTIEKQNLPPQHVWHAADIEWPSGAVTLKNEVVDCSANWEDGCKLPLP